MKQELMDSILYLERIKKEILLQQNKKNINNIDESILNNSHC
jgi:hypothetical protein